MRDPLGPSIRTLVVDRDPAVVQEIEAAFAAHKLGAVERAGSPEQARVRLSEGHPKFDLAVVEFGDSGELGTDLLKWVRHDPVSATPALPIIVTSPIFTAEQVRRSIDSGADYFLTKPITRERVVAAVERSVVKPRRFIVTANYVGPDRRTRKDRDAMERRYTTDQRFRLIRDPFRFSIEADGALVVAFDHIADGKPRALPADAVRKAIAAVSASRERAAEAMGDYSSKLDDDFVEFGRHPFGDARVRLHGTATEAAQDSSAAGFMLMSSVSRSLAHYTGGDYLVSGRLMEFIKAHLIAFRTAVRHRILDDGGAIGRELMGLVVQARKVFTSKG
jgi:DNA-binding NarL/FixJ family response regulator